MNQILLAALLFSGVSYCQSNAVSVENKLTVSDTNTTTPFAKPSDEGTNNPIITGSVKYTVNGINYYIKQMKTSLSLLLKKRNRFLSSLAFCVFVLANSFNAYSQSCSATNFGTVGRAVTCLDFVATPSGAGSSAGCTGSGFGGSGTARIIQFCTNASNQCVSFDFSGLASANGTEISLWTTCSAGALSGYVTNSINCYSGSEERRV